MNTPECFHRLTPELERLLCELLHVDIETCQQTKALYATGRAWRVMTRPKRRGVRIIHDPSDPLKAMNRAILKEIIQPLPVHMCVHGCRPRTSVVTNTRVHAGFGKAFYVLDLKDAFPSTKRERLDRDLMPQIRQRLTATMDLDSEAIGKLSDVILELLLVDNALPELRDDEIPQGFPTSPAVLNVVLRPVDREISEYLRKIERELGQAFRMTRYVDDITISTDGDEIPKSVRRKIRRIVNGNGWTIARTKVRYHGQAETGDDERSTKAPVITGLVPQLDGRVTIPRPRLNRFRSIIHRTLQIAQKRIDGDELAIASARTQMEKDLAHFARAGIVIPATDPAEFYTSCWPLTTAERDQIVGIVGFVGMVYDQQLPAIIRKVYLEAKTKLRIGRKATRRWFYPDEASIA